MALIGGRKEDEPGEFQFSEQQESALARVLNQRLRRARESPEERTRLATGMQLAGIDLDIFYRVAYHLTDPSIQRVYDAAQGNNIEEVTKRARKEVLDLTFGSGKDEDMYFQFARELVHESWGNQNFQGVVARATSNVYDTYLKHEESQAGLHRAQAEAYVRAYVFNEEVSDAVKRDADHIKSTLHAAEAKKKAFSVVVGYASSGTSLAENVPEEVKQAERVSGINLEDVELLGTLEPLEGEARQKRNQLLEKIQSYDLPRKIVGFMQVASAVDKDTKNGFPKWKVLQRLAGVYQGDPSTKGAKVFTSLKAAQVIDGFKPEMKRVGGGLDEIIDDEQESTARAYQRIIDALKGLDLQEEYLQKAVETGIIYAGVRKSQRAEEQAHQLLAIGENYVRAQLEKIDELEDARLEMVSHLIVSLANGYSLLGNVQKTEQMTDLHAKNFDGMQTTVQMVVETEVEGENGKKEKHKELQLVPFRSVAPLIERRCYINALRDGRAEEIDADERSDLLEYFRKEKAAELQDVVKAITAFEQAHGREVPELRKVGWREEIKARNIADEYHAEALAILTGRDGMPRGKSLREILNLETP